MARTLVASLLTVALLGGCSATIPADPEGTLERVTGGTLRVGVSPNPPWTDLPSGTDAEPEGIEPDLVRDFAETIDADIEWTSGGEEDLMGRLEDRELDLVVGGLTARSPWSSHVALTYRYLETVAADGQKELRVMAVPMGENAFLVELERFLLTTEVRA